MKKYEVTVDETGTERWYLNGKLHRDDGPAGELADGTKVWYLNGEHDRTDGPAVEWPDGTKEWWVDGVELTEEEFNNRNRTLVATIKVYSDGSVERVEE